MSQKPRLSASMRIASGRIHSESSLSAASPLASSGREYEIEVSFFCQAAHASGCSSAAVASSGPSNSTYGGRGGYSAARVGAGGAADAKGLLAAIASAASLARAASSAASRKWMRARVSAVLAPCSRSSASSSGAESWQAAGMKGSLAR